ncbi:MAG: tetratricopeptide repeat protein [Tepidisphaeraceae bacterium]
MTTGESAFETQSQRPGPIRAPDFGWFAGIVALALVLRIVFVFQARSVVFFEHLVVDSRAYNDWAQRIAAGEWVGRGVFYQAPLYPYFLAVVEKAVGHDLLRVRMVQAGIGAISCGLIFLAARGFFSGAAGIVAGAMLAVYPPAIYFDGLIQKSVLDLFFSALLLWTLSRAWFDLCAPRWCGAGASLGLLCLTRENALILAPVLAVAALIHGSAHGLTVRAIRFAFFAAGMSLVLLPVGIRNRIVGGEFALTTAQAGTNFYMGNNANSTGMSSPLVAGRSNPHQEREDATRLAERALGARLSPAQVSRYWFGRAFAFIRDQPLTWLRQTGWKAALVINAYEVPDSEDQYFYERHSELLRTLDRAWHFGVLAPLAAAGVALTWRRRRELWILYLIWPTLALSVVAFHVYARYRFPLVPVMILFAAGAITSLGQVVRDKRWTELTAAGALAVIVAAASNWRIFAPGAHLALSYHNAGAALADAGELPRAVDYLRESLRADPNAVEPHAILGLTLARMGRPSEAIDELQTALTLNPNDAIAQYAIGTVYAESGSTVLASQHLARAVELDRLDRQAVMNLAAVLARMGQWSQAVERLRQGLASLPDDPVLECLLARMLATCPIDRLRDGSEAVRLAMDACRQTGSDVASLEALSVSLAEVGRFDEAVAAAQRASELARNQGDEEAANALLRHVSLFRSRRPLRVN